MSRWNRLASELVRHDSVSDIFDSAAFILCIVALVALLVGLNGACL